MAFAALAGQFAVTGAAMVALIDDLERERLVTRGRNPTDRRAYLVAITDAGRTRLADAHAVAVATEAALCAPLGERGEHELRALMRRLLGID